MDYRALLMLVVVLGFAPFYPQPHIIQKIEMLMSGQLSRPVDIFDLLMHGSPFLLLGLKLIMDVRERLSRRQHPS